MGAQYKGIRWRVRYYPEACDVEHWARDCRHGFGLVLVSSVRKIGKHGNLTPLCKDVKTMRQKEPILRHDDGHLVICLVKQ
jgi:hypothetical protein